MVMLTGTGVWKLEKSLKTKEGQTIMLKAKNRDTSLMICGIPSDVDLHGNVWVNTYDAEGRDDSAENNINKKPFKLEFYQRDDEGNILPDDGAELYITENGSYRHRTQEEIQKTDQTNGLPPISILARRIKNQNEG